jgi:hypothetical protein
MRDEMAGEFTDRAMRLGTAAEIRREARRFPAKLATPAGGSSRPQPTL